MKHFSTQYFTRFLPALLLILLLSSTAPAATSPADATEPCIRVRDIFLTGNHHFSTMRLKLRLKNWTTSLLPGSLNCLNDAWLKADIKNLTAFYRKKHFADVQIDTSLSPIPGKDAHRLTIAITEGPRYDISFTGNTFFSRRQLNKEISIFKKGDLNGSGLRRDRNAIRKKYREAGFSEVEVTLETQPTTTPKETIKQVVYTIRQGTRRVVESLDITGNQTVETKKILDAVITRPAGLIASGGFSPDVLTNDLNAIGLLYYSQGFLNTDISHEIRVEPTDTKKDAPDDTPPVESIFISIRINEGPRTRVNQARISGLEDIIPLSAALEAITLSTGEPFRDYMVKSDANTLAAMISEKGYPHVKVTGEAHLNPDKTLADITWQAVPGPFTRFGGIHYKGNERLQEKIIQRKVNITPGDPFSLKKLFATQKKIREIRSVASVNITVPGLKQREPAPDLEVIVKERKPYYVEAAAGFDTENLAYLKVKTGDTNFMGRDMNAWVEGYVSGIGHRLEAGAREPYFLDTEIAAVFTLFQEEESPLNQDFGTRSWGAESGFSRRLTPHLTAGLNFEYENRVQFDGDNAEQAETRNILITSSSLAWDNRDAPLKPTRGFLSFASVDLFSGFNNDLDRFLKYQLDIRHYRKLFKGVTLALAGRVGHIQPLGASNSVAEDQLFFLGGISDVRGFRENMLSVDNDNDALGGRTSISASLETRIDLPADFELTFFLDTGRIDDTDTPSASPDEFRYTVGTGLRYNTPIGPVGLLYGHKLNRESGESAGRFHLSIGYSF